MNTLASVPTAQPGGNLSVSPRTTSLVAIAANFTAEPLRDCLEFWLDQLGLSYALEFAPFDQIFQELLSPDSLLSRNASGINVLLLRFDPWLEATTGGDLSKFDSNLELLISTLSNRGSKGNTTTLVCTCPLSARHAGVEKQAWVQRARERLQSAFSASAEVDVIAAEDVVSAYPLEFIYDAHAEDVGAIPYAEEFFAALGTYLARRVHRLKRPPYKVLALDCDNTLWKGIVGEDGPQGVEITPEHRVLQEFAVRQVEAGMLLCLCSKNNEADVWEVFDAHPEMPLRREHILTHRLNWNPKSANLISLASELKLGLDSFIFIDDSPLECAEVGRGCCDVLTLQMPSSDVEGFLKNVWAFDRGRASKEDQERTALYRQNLERDKERAQATTIADFLAGLDLRVAVQPLSAERVARVSDLTQRTNQFNATTVRRTPAEIAAMIDGSEHRCLTIEVSDRFGDYGLVGVIIFGFDAEAVKVDSLLLSCRALGRGVEYRMLEELGRIASERGVARVDIPFVPTRKNHPVREFLERVGSSYRDMNAEPRVFRFPVDFALKASSEMPQSLDSAAAADEPLPKKNDAENHAQRAAVLAHIACSLRTPNSVLRAIAERARRKRVAEGYVAPRNSLEQRVALIWGDVLHIDKVSVFDDFFQLGGTSIKAAQVVARVRKEFASHTTLVQLFERPTLEGFARAIADSKVATEGDLPNLQRRPSNEVRPLSFNQQRVWFIDRLRPNVPVYNIPHAFRITGEVDETALRECIESIVQRHETLRTSILTVDGEPIQEVSTSASAPFEIIRAAGKDEDWLQQQLVTQAAWTFDLGQGPLFRVALFRKSATDAVLVLNLHHAIGDGWSIGVFLRELTQLYSARALGSSAALTALPIQYADYARWQRQCTGAPVLTKQIAYWKDKLANAPAVLELPTDRQRPPMESFRGGCRFFRVPEELAARVRTRASEHDVTPFMFLLAAFQAMLARYARQEDILVGIPVAGRRQVETEPLIGFFADTLVIRTDCGNDPPFSELLTRVRKSTLEAFAHADVPLETLIEELKPPRLANVNPLFQVMFVLQPPRDTLQLGTATATPLELHNGTSKFDLTVSLEESGAGFAGSWEYSTDIFDADTAERMVRHFRMLLDGATRDARQTLSRLPLITEAERQQILGEWAGPTLERPSVASLAAMLDDQCQKTPNHVAVIGTDEELSYRELHDRAGALSVRLRQAGIGPERLVGIALERSTMLLVAILAVIKAGGAYVPLDPAYPRDRIDFMLRDADAHVLLTQRSLRDLLPEHPRTIFVDDELWEAQSSAAYLPEQATPANLAYVIYTSGSTGRPKGVAVEQRSTVEFIHWALDRFTPGELAGTLFATSICFDLSIFEMFVPLCSGGAVIIADNALHLPTLPARNRVTLINTVPSAMAELTRAGEVPSSVRVVNLAGEPLPVELAQAIYALPHIEKLYNLYGPTEDTTYSTEVLVPRHVDRMDIGVPLPNTRAYILDRTGQPVPCGLLGELHLAGAGLARGYLNRPELTAEKFIANHLNGSAAPRMYRTGDLCRWLPSGRIDFLGRIDHQVKIRGFRIELGEIENELRRFPGVRDVVVAPWKTPAGTTALAAYITASPVPTAEDLRAFLHRTLPEYMTPAAFVFLDEMPLTPNGKIDRKRLPTPELDSAAQGEFVEPRDTVEKTLAAIWAEHLGLPKVGVTSNFFDLGGHSLLAVRIFAAIEKAFGRKLPLATLFRQPTIEQVAALLREEEKSEDAPLLVDLRSSGSRPPLFCVPGANDYGFGLRDLARHLGDDQPVYSLSFERWADNTGQPPGSLEDLVRLFVNEVRRVQGKGPYHLLGYCYGGWFVFEAARQLLLAGEEIGSLVMVDAFGPPFSPIAHASSAERRRQRIWHFQDLSLSGKLRFVARRVDSRVSKFRSRILGNSGAVVDGDGEDDTPFLPLSGIYAARPIASSIDVIRSAQQPEWYVRFGNDLSDLGWGRFGTKGIRHWVVPCKRDEAILEPNVADVATAVRRILDGA